MAMNLSFKAARIRSTLWIRPKARVVVRGMDELPRRVPGEKRVYILLNRATSFDLAALVHVSEKPFAIVVDGKAADFPLVSPMLRGARMILLDPASPEAGIVRGLEVLSSGKSLVVPLRCGEELSSVGIRIARAAGAGLYPVFLKAEDDRVRSLSFHGGDGTMHPYTVIKNSFYFIEFLKPLDLPALPGDEDCLAVAESLGALSEGVQSRYEAYLGENRERFASLKRKGGSRLRVAW